LKPRQKTPEPITVTLYGCDAFAHMRQALTSHPESVMVLVSCIFYADGLLRGMHTARPAAKCIDARLFLGRGYFSVGDGGDKGTVLLSPPPERERRQENRPLVPSGCPGGGTNT